MSTGRSKSRIGDETGRLTPGAHLRAEIERLGLDQVAVSKATGVSRQSINNIINSRQPISRAMAAKLGRLTGRNSDYWLRAFFSGDSEPQHITEARLGGVLVDHQIVRAIKDGVIGIDPFNAGNVHAAAIDLTIAKSLMLAASEVVTMRTKERIELPSDYLGRIGIADRLASAGVFSTQALQLEPGFKGRIGICLFNASKASVRLRIGEAVLRLEIVRLGTTPNAKITT